MISAFERVAETAQHDEGHAVSWDDAFGRRIEGPTMTVRRKNSAVAEDVALPLRDTDRSPAGDGHVAVEVAQRLDGEANRNQRRGTGGLHSERRTLQVQLVRGAGRQVVLVVAEEKVEAGDVTRME